MKNLLLIILCIGTSVLYSVDYYEDRPIARIDLFLETKDPDVTIDEKAIRSKMQTKTGDPFSQLLFDGDLKMLSQDYFRILHDEKIVDGKVYITLRLWPNPTIRQIQFVGNNKLKSTKLQSELEVSSGEVFNRKDFNERFNHLKEFYVKQGFFEAQLIYVVNPVEGKNQVDIEIDVIEGKSGNIQRVILQGFTEQERNTVYQMMATRKYNFLTSWLTGAGFYEEDRIQHDRMVILTYLHNQGYADARVNMEIKDDPVTGEILVVITADKGKIYRFGKITFEGNSLLKDEEIQELLFLNEEAPYSPENLHNAIQNIKDLYGKHGYIDANIDYDTELLLDEPRYNVHLQINEGEKFSIGMIHIIGNETTMPNVILRESLLVPGETFDTRKLKATQQRLENIGYFKNVNVYAVRTVDDDLFGPGYRDVYIEVEEGSTGSINLSIGANSTDSVFGTLELSEKNFYLGGFGKIGRKGLSALRGGGEYFSAKAQLGDKQQNYVLAWMNPYFRDSYWRIGTNLSYQTERIRSDDIKSIVYGAEFFASYPLSMYLTFGSRYRLKHTNTNPNSSVDEIKDPNQGGLTIVSTGEIEENNDGLLSGVGLWIGYDSTDRIYKPFRGIRSQLTADVVGIGGQFHFFKTNFVNTAYFPITRMSTFKTRADIGFIIPFERVDNLETSDFIQNGMVLPNTPDQEAVIKKARPFGDVPYTERFFLGGVDTVRGYKPMILGPTYLNRSDATGGLSYSLLSAEYLYRLLPMVDIFAFFDAGMVSGKELTIDTYQMSYGWGVRLEIMGQAPVTLGWGYPINPDGENQVQNFFFSFGTTF